MRGSRVRIGARERDLAGKISPAGKKREGLEQHVESTISLIASEKETQGLSGRENRSMAAGLAAEEPVSRYSIVALAPRSAGRRGQLFERLGQGKTTRSTSRQTSSSFSIHRLTSGSAAIFSQAIRDGPSSRQDRGPWAWANGSEARFLPSSISPSPLRRRIRHARSTLRRRVERRPAELDGISRRTRQEIVDDAPFLDSSPRGWAGRTAAVPRRRASSASSNRAIGDEVNFLGAPGRPPGTGRGGGIQRCSFPPASEVQQVACGSPGSHQGGANMRDSHFRYMMNESQKTP